MVVVPPGTQHAFAAAPGEIADMLVIITPGVERFEHKRLGPASNWRLWPRN
ncbi:hypothetical protein GCM10018779_32870 [Streptomyces griseocarneus]|nr:hypothetical protein GCM10018779_32870 [Streptomyces griseocarneus]